jgi:hypothetical protein
MMMIGGRLFTLMSASPLKFETQKSAKSRGVGALRHSKLLSRSKIHFGMAVHVREERNPPLFEGALISASSLGLASFFGSIISHVCTCQIQHDHVRITETTSHQLRRHAY